jgi:hypothetical protein
LGISTGCSCNWSDFSATRAERLADRVAANVATASTNVPPAVASDATTVQSVLIAD